MGHLFQRVPLAWRNLTHGKLRFLVAPGGITFAALLMFVEMGFYTAMLDSTTALIDRMDGELVLLSRAKYSLTIKETFARRRLQQAEAVDGVSAACPLYLDRRGLWKNPDDRGGPHLRHIRVLAFDPDSPALDLYKARTDAAELKLPGTVLADLRSRRFYGDLHAGPAAGRELSGRAVRIVGNFRLGTDFANDGNLVMSDRNYAEFFADPLTGESPLGQVDIGVVRLVSGSNPLQVKAALMEALPDDVVVMTREEFARQEKSFWLTNTPIGFVFLVGLVMGFLVGVVICYQVLAADVYDHLPEYATLKAIGYHDRYLTGVVLREALLLSALGYVPGILLSQAFYLALSWQTGLPCG